MTTWEGEHRDDERTLDEGDGLVTEAGELDADALRPDVPEADAVDQRLDAPLDDDDVRR